MQAARGAAALSVAAYHYAREISTSSPMFDNWLNFGRLGVDFFFVLSGFIILYAHSTDIGNPKRLWTYVGKRAARIYPTYWAVLVPVAAYQLSQGALSLQYLDWLTSVSLIRFTPLDTPVGVAWTLFHEILFYAAFAALVFDKRLGMVVFGAWLALILMTFRFPLWGNFSFWDTLTSTYNLNFFLGMAIYHLIKVRSVGRGAAIAGILAAVAGIGMLAAYEHVAGENTVLRLSYAILFTLMIFGLVHLDMTSVRVPKVLLLIGEASFVIYLLHPITNRLAFGLAGNGSLPDAAGLALALGLVSIAGIVIHLVAERPMLSLLRPNSRDLQRPTFAVLSSAR